MTEEDLLPVDTFISMPYIVFNYLHRTVQTDSPAIGDKHGEF
jgi:hypothetical protein